MERPNEGSASGNPIDALNVEPAVAQAATEAAGHRRRIGFIRRFFWLDARIGDVAHAGLGAEHSGWREFEAASEARHALSRLSDLSSSNTAVLALRRVEALELVLATMKRHGVEVSGAHLTERDWQQAESIDELRRLRARLSASQRASLEACLAEDGQSYLLRLDKAGRRRAGRSLAQAAQQLSEPFQHDQRAIERLRLRRWIGVGIAALVLLALCGFGVSRIQKQSQSDNLAFHRPVTASSTADPAYINTDRLVDGDVHNLGFHTTAEDPHPWAQIDLGAPKHFSKVMVYNREDCCKERQVPLVIEASDDGVNFERVAERSVKFDQWTADGLDARGRYVRLRLEGSGMFHLAEVGIYP